MVAGGSEAARQTGIPERTINQWLASGEFAELRDRKKSEVAAEWWAGIQQIARSIVRDIDSAPVRDRAVALGILAEKMLLVSGEATERYETRDLSGVLDDHELELLRRAIHAATEPAEEAAVAGAGEGQPASA